jgi:murein DD-endopeptidase MepM/ murein hydrolase activator NlpD
MLAKSKFAFIGIVACFVISSPVFQLTYAQSPTDESLTEIQKKIQNNNKRLQPKKQQRKMAQKSLFQINRALQDSNVRLKHAQENLATIKKEAETTKKTMQTLYDTYIQHQVQFKQRIREVYKSGEWGVLALFFLPDTVTEAHETAFYFEQVLQKDIALISDSKSQYQQLKEAQKRHQAQLSKIRQLENQIQTESDALDAKRALQYRHIRSLTSQIKEIEKQNRELEQSSKKIERFIKKAGEGRVEYWGTGDMISPARGWLSSQFGLRKHPISKRWARHNGIDIAARKGTRIYASDSGKVIFAGQNKSYRGYGKMIIIDHGTAQHHGKSISTFYAHASRIMVKKGQFVKKGDEIALVGETGYATGPHLHFEIREDGRPVDPMGYIKF